MNYNKTKIWIIPSEILDTICYSLDELRKELSYIIDDKTEINEIIDKARIMKDEDVLEEFDIICQYK